MSSALEIANMALGYVGDEVIAAFGDQNKRARLSTLYFAAARRRALRLGAWNCCSKRVSLPVDATAPVWGYTYRYLLPPDYIRLVAVEDASHEYKFSVEDGYILTDLETPLTIKYVFDDADVSGFDPLLTTVMAHCLAIDLVTPLARSTSKKTELKDDLKTWLGQAGKVDGVERPPQNFQDTSWLRARARGG